MKWKCNLRISADASNKLLRYPAGEDIYLKAAVSNRLVQRARSLYPKFLAQLRFRRCEDDFLQFTVRAARTAIAPCNVQIRLRGGNEKCEEKTSSHDFYVVHMNAIVTAYTVLVIRRFLETKPARSTTLVGRNPPLQREN